MAAKSKRTATFGDLDSIPDLHDNAVEREQPKRDHIQKRFEIGSEIANMQLDNITALSVDPKLVRIPEHHNRDYSALNEENCAELIEGIKSSGQLLAGEVTLSTTEGYKYDIVYGARRHWVCNYLKIPFRIHVRDYTPEMLFKVRDQENRNRKDISAYERGCEYRLAIDMALFSSSSQLADAIGLTQRQVQRLIKMSYMPVELVRIIEDITELSENAFRSIRELYLDENDNLLPDMIDRLASVQDKSVSVQDLKSFAAETTSPTETKPKVNKHVLRDPNSDKVMIRVSHNAKDPNATIKLQDFKSMDKSRFIDFMSQAYDLLHTES